MERDYYKVLIVGPSGRGKTFSLRNLDRKTTGFINVENKPLPFKPRFEHEDRILKMAGSAEPHQQVFQSIRNMAVNPDLKVIVIDSFSAFVDHVLLYCRETKKGFDVYTEYNAQIGMFMDFVKRCKKEVYVVAHDAPPSFETDQERRVKVKGNEWAGVVEKEFTIVVWADMKKVDKKLEYFFNLRKLDTSTKIPPDIFGPTVDVIPNDVALLDKAIKQFAETA